MSTTNKVMTTHEVAKRFNHFAQEGKWIEAVEELFAEDAVSVEPAYGPGPHTVTGKNPVKQKSVKFAEAVEAMHGGYSSEPVVGGNYFSVAMGMDVTMKGKERSKMDEIAVYEVKDGKIVKEQFFY